MDCLSIDFLRILLLPTVSLSEVPQNKLVDLFLPPRKIAFSVSCVLRVTHAGKLWLRGHFSVAMAPEALPPGSVPIFPRKVKATSKRLFPVPARHVPFRG